MEIPYHLDHFKNLNCRTTSNNRTTLYYAPPNCTYVLTPKSIEYQNFYA